MLNTAICDVYLAYGISETKMGLVAGCLRGSAELRGKHLIGPPEDVLASLDRIYRTMEVGLESASFSIQIPDAIRHTSQTDYELGGIKARRGYHDALTTIAQLERQGRIAAAFAISMREWIKRLAALPLWPVEGYIDPILGPLTERIGGTMTD